VARLCAQSRQIGPGRHERIRKRAGAVTRATSPALVHEELTDHIEVATAQPPLLLLAHDLLALLRHHLSRHRVPDGIVSRRAPR
jgi:hypothetical protein